MQVGLGALLYAVQADKNPYLNIQSDAAFDYLFTATIIAFLAGILRYTNNRTVALILFLYSIINVPIIVAHVGGAKGNLIIALVAVWAAGRATYATFKFHGRFAQRAAPPPNTNAPKPDVDFVSHPSGGVESTAATAASADRSQKPYDKEKWNAFIKYDEDIARVAARIRPLGEQWLDELARAYLALNDKQYLARIEEKIIADAMAWTARARL
jgi:uncharacterized integral membrane protein